MERFKTLVVDSILNLNRSNESIVTIRSLDATLRRPSTRQFETKPSTMSSPSPPPGGAQFPLACAAVASFRADKRKSDASSSAQIGNTTSSVANSTEKQLSCRKGDALRVLCRAGESRTWVLCENLRTGRRGVVPLCFLSCDRLLDSSQRNFVFFRVRAIADSDAGAAGLADCRSQLSFKEGECFTVLATRTHKQFVWKGRHKNVTGLFSADRVVEIDEGGTAVAPTPVVGAWSAAFELAVSQSVSSMGVAGDESSPFSSPRRTRTPSPRRGHSLPGAGDAVRTDPLPTISRSQSQTLRSDGSSISSSATDHHKVRRRRRGVTESPGAGSVRVRSDASSRPHSHNMETEVLMLSPRDDDMYLSPRAAASEPGGLVSGSMSGDDESEGAHGKPSASHSGVFAGQTTPTSLRLLVVVRNANGSPVQANIDGSGTNKLTVTSTRSGPPRHFKVLAPLLADNMPSTYVVEVERIAGTVVDVAIDDVPVSGSPVKL